jgi:hypothetical protein
MGRFAVGVWAVAALVSCGGSVEIEQTSGGAGGQASAGGGGTTGGNGSSGGGPSLPPEVELDDVGFFADCMPVVTPDSMQGGFTIVADHTGGTVAMGISLGPAVLIFEGNPPGLYEFEVAPAGFTVEPGEIALSSHEKVPGSATGPLNACAYCGNVGELTIDVSVDGITHTLKADGFPLGCAF